MKQLLLLLPILIQSLLANSQQDQRYHPTFSTYYEDVYDCENTISSTDFRLALLKIKQQPTSAGKKVLAKKIASSYCLSASQVYKLCMTLALNADRLSIAKKCYKKCLNPEEYDIVFEAMSTNNMVNELNDYIEMCNSQDPDDDDNDHNYPKNNCRKPMSQTAFSGAKQTIEDASFDETKLETAKTISSTNCMTTDQVIEICRLFSFEKTKLDFAKYAYSHAYDKNNYFKVGTVFSFDASKTELNTFIQSQGNKTGY